MLLNVIGTIVIVLASHTWGMYFFAFENIPWIEAGFELATTSTMNVSIGFSNGQQYNPFNSSLEQF